MSLLTQAILAAEGPNNPILPVTEEVIWGTIAFVILFAGLAYAAYPAIKKTMDDRTARIQGDLDDAERSKTEAAQALEEYKAQLADAKAEAARIIEEARQSADGVKAQLEERAKADIAALKTQAQADIEATKAQAIADLQGQVADMAIGAAEVVVRKNLDKATQTQLVEDYINRVGAQS